MTEEKRKSGSELTLSCGKSLHLLPVSKLAMQDARLAAQREFEKRGEQTEPPTYVVPTIGGGEKTFYHDKESIKTATEEEVAAWVAFQDASKRLEIEENERILVTLIEDGVMEEPTEDWLAKMGRRGVNVPEEPGGRKVFYVMREYLRTGLDVQLFSSSMMLLAEGIGEVDENALDAVSELFRGKIRELSGSAFEQLAKALGEGGEAGGLVAQPGVPEGESGEGVADTTQ